MATVSRVSLQEYLESDYELEGELVSGALLPKPTGTLEHREMERWLLRLLERYEQADLGRAVHDLSIRYGGDVRVPDLVFVQPGARFEGGIMMDLPLLCVEILSPSQRLSWLFAKYKTYHAWGVPYCWVVDPVGKLAWEYHRDAPVRLLSGNDSLRAGEIQIGIGELFR
jgi:Uma2 family endonuclease